MKIAAVILAAGSSKRMGKPKQLLKVGPSTILGVVVNSTVASNVDQVFCVLGAHALEISLSIQDHNVETIVNPNFKDGLSSSIIEGIQHLQTKDFDAILIVLGDQPLVSTNYLDQMVDAFKAHPNSIMASRYRDELGVPALLPKEYFPELMALKGDKGAKVLLNRYKERVIAMDHDRLMDIDTQEDYQELMKKWNL